VVNETLFVCKAETKNLFILARNKGRRDIEELLRRWMFNIDYPIETNF
jgi:hypothetical protein